MSAQRRSPAVYVARRKLLAGLAGSAILAPFVPILQAETLPGAPKRLILMFHPHGVIRDTWLPTGTVTNFTLSKTLEPLNAFKDKLLILDGLRLSAETTAGSDPALVGEPSGGPHTRNTSHLWSGAALDPNSSLFSRDATKFGWGLGTSIDQTIAERIGTTAFRSLEVGVRPGGGNAPRNRMIYRAPGQPLSPEGSPKALFDRLFTGGMGGSALGEQLRQDRKSILDLVLADLQRLEPRVAREDSAKIKAHLEAIRAIETRLSSSAALCATPTAPADFDAGANDNMPMVADLQIKLLASAIGCGLTNVASIQFDRNENSGTLFNWLFTDTRAHHELSHISDADALSKLTQIYTWYAKQLAALMTQLAAFPEGSGSALDNTLIVWCSEVANPQNHQTTNSPFVLAGGAGGALKMGRFLSYDNVQHNRLLVSLAHLFGLDTVQSYGKTDVGSGPLTSFI